MIKNVVFDIGMVLIDFAWKATMEELGFDEKCIKTLEEKLMDDPLWDEFDLGIIPEEEVLEKAIKRMPKYEKELRIFWENNLMTIRPFDYSEKWIKSLKERGLKTFLLTNYPDSLFDKSVKNAFPFYPYIDGEVVSSRVKKRKPDKEIYECLLNKYNLKSEECVFFDDRQVNVDAAKKLGFNAFVFKGYEEAVKDLSTLLPQ